VLALQASHLKPATQRPANKWQACHQLPLRQISIGKIVPVSDIVGPDAKNPHDFNRIRTIKAAVGREDAERNLPVRTVNTIVAKSAYQCLIYRPGATVLNGLIQLRCLIAAEVAIVNLSVPQSRRVSLS